jgi:RNA polymerase sigma factor (sigma-70 family)
MQGRRSVSATQSVRPLLPVPPSEDVADADLLDRFVRRKDEAAFSALLERHGPMVLGVCRRLLQDPHEADDAFQATFLIFLQKARSLRDPASLGNWLYGVAHRVARRARTVAARWRVSERQVPEMAAADDSPDAVWDELRPMLDEEIAQLPRKYQAPVILCYLEGKTYTEAARILGWAEGTVSGRLARARDRLRNRLALRGLALSGAIWPVLLSQKGTDIVSPTLVATIKKGALAVITGRSAAPAFSTKVAALARGTLRALLIGKVKVVLLGLIATCMLGGAAVIVDRWMNADEATVLFSTLHAWKDKFHRHLENLEGTWELVSLEKEGRPLSADEVAQRKLVWTIKANQIVMRSTTDETTARYTPNPSENPKRIDLIFTSGPEKQEQKVQGIYMRTNGTLQVCYDPKGEVQPKKFETAAGGSVLFMVFKKREKSE